MGDHRASVKITIEFHGIKRTSDMWINYDGWNGTYEGVDDRIIEFCREVWEEGMQMYITERQEYEDREREKAERKEYKRLKKKYKKNN